MEESQAGAGPAVAAFGDNGAFRALVGMEKNVVRS
jgi:hypothetical protein